MFKKNHKPRPSAAIEEFNSSSDTVSLRAKLENERMSRRQALRKMGVMSGVAVLALLTVDDLARMAAKQLASSGGDSELAGSVAKSLRGAGVAFADPLSTQDPSDSGWSSQACVERGGIDTSVFLFQNMPPENGDSASGVESFCLQHYAANDYSGYGNCLISGLYSLVDADVRDMARRYLQCRNDACASGKEGKEDCKSLFQPGIPV